MFSFITYSPFYIVVKFVFQSVFRLEIYQNSVFFKKLVLIPNTSKQFENTEKI